MLIPDIGLKIIYKKGDRLFDLPNFANFLAGACIAGIGAVVFAALLHSAPGDRRAVGSLELSNNGSRFIAGAYALIALWIGIRVAKTVGDPTRWADAAEMGWVFLGATAASSAAFILRSALPKWTLGLSVVGLCTMAHVTWSS